jgi:hypothetical protein
LITTSGTGAPSIDGIRIRNTGSATVYVGGSAVTTATGYPVASTDAIANIPNTGAAQEGLYGISTATVSVAFIQAG